ncbi:ThuA domain-containing protein [Solirubrobacter phytolaccae]|uniref:ThuA domain-containing protein n=1 Tax=Solirubrobacter phytolaccae TaxID=1404360 RepID=A0A9X3NBE4_9ACTN|nr:ThuA domain-containing protein [Solirubrobacter phytolaccae]MDA0183278.1 ThuA domain-containing protein [Solirubrobacter phytolaccae]
MLAAAMLLSGGATAYAQNANPTVTASRTPTGAVRVGVPIQFTAVGADADSDALTYAWTFGDNTTSTEQNPSKTYLAAGTYTATVTVSDGKGGTGTASVAGISIQANRAPSISVGSATPAAGVVPFTTQLAATATDADGHTVSYAWDLDGDGTFETTERNPSLNLTAAGDKTVTLRASDPFGGVATRAVTIAGLAATPDPAKKFHVLVFSKTAGFRHGSIGPGITAIKLLGEQNNFGVDAIEDATLFTDAFLSRYDAVIWLSTTGDVLNDTQQAAFERYIQGGGGYVGIHAASDTEYTWPWYGRLVGGYFRNHPNGTPTATVVREDATHVSTAHLPERWTRVDEWYNFQGITNPVVNGGGTDVSPRTQTPIHVLLTVDESTYNESDGNTTDDDHPVSWCKRFDGGRMFYTALGHTNQSFTEAPFLQHLVNGIDVAAGYTSDLSCGIYKANTSGDVGGTVAPTLSLALGTPTPLGPFTPGVARSYTSTATATVTSTAGDGTLSVSDPSTNATGRLVNGAFSLPQPLEVMAASAGGTGGAFTPLSTTGAPVNVLTYSGPVSSDAVTVSTRQAIGANDALRTGTYAKTLTFTLSTTTP